MQQLFSLVPRNNTFSFASHKGGWGEVSEKNHYPSPASLETLAGYVKIRHEFLPPHPLPHPITPHCYSSTCSGLTRISVLLWARGQDAFRVIRIGRDLDGFM